MERPKIRIGKDFTVLWNIYKRENGVKTPYMLAAGKENYVLRLWTPYGKQDITRFDIDENTIQFDFLGKDQKHLGNYSLELVERKNAIGMVTVDTAGFTLVAYSRYETDGGDSDVVIQDVKLESELGLTPMVSLTIDTELSETSHNAVSNYVITEKFKQVDDKIKVLQDAVEALDIQSIETAIENKVDKVPGKQLSTEDFTTELKQKLQDLRNDPKYFGPVLEGEPQEDIVWDQTTGKATINLRETGATHIVYPTLTQSNDVFYKVVSLEELYANPQLDLNASKNGGQGSVRLSVSEGIVTLTLAGTGAIYKYPWKAVCFNNGVVSLSEAFLPESAVKKNDLAQYVKHTELADFESEVVDAKLATKQEKLKSGENIKTINGQSILGEGDIEIKGGSSTFVTDFTVNDLYELVYRGAHPVQANIVALQRALENKERIVVPYGTEEYKGYSILQGYYEDLVYFTVADENGSTYVVEVGYDAGEIDRDNVTHVSPKENKINIADLQAKDTQIEAKLTELSKEIGIVKGYYESNTLIFDKSQIAVGSKIKVSFVLYHPTGKVSVYDAEGKELKGFYITNGEIGQNYTFDSYVLPENYESVKVAGWGELNVEILVESLNPKHIAQSVAELESQVSELKSKPSEILPNKSVSAEKLEDYDLLPVFITATNNDLNAIIEELYVFPQYVGSSQIQVRTYSKGIIVGAFNNNGVRLWAVRAYHLAESYKNGELIPLVVEVTNSDVDIDTLIGYCVIKDIDALTNASNDSTNGEFVNLSKATQSWLNPKISALRNMPIIESGASESSLITGVDIAIPNEIIAVEGDTLQIFWRSIIGAANPYIFDIVAECSVGKSYPRYFVFTPTTSQIGKSYNMTINVKGNDGMPITSKTTTLKVVAKRTAPTTETNVLCIGASATEGGVWANELRRRLTASDGNNTPLNPLGLGLSNITFVGRKVGTSVNVPLEATGGWRVQNYASAGERAIRFQVANVEALSLGATYTQGSTIYVVQEVNVTNGTGNIRCTLQSSYVAPTASGVLTRKSGSGDDTIAYSSYSEETFSPFWNDNTNQLDFASYADNFCNGHIDVMVWHCGVNDLSGATIASASTTINAVLTSYRDLMRAYHSQFPNGKVIISSVPIGSVNGGFAANYGASATSNYFVFAKKVQMYAQALETLCKEEEFKSFAFYAPVLEEFDAENGYPQTETPVNNRSEVKENVGTNGVHPTPNGSLMVADAIYRTFNNLNL